MRKILAIAVLVLLSITAGWSYAPTPLSAQGPSQIASNTTCAEWNTVEGNGKSDPWADGFETGYALAALSILPVQMSRRITVREVTAAITSRCADHPNDNLVAVTRWVLGGPEPGTY